MSKKNIVILTAGENGKLVSNLINENRLIDEFIVKGYLDDDISKHGKIHQEEMVLGNINSWEKYVSRNDTVFTSFFIL